jgi:hypothetical protein
MRLWLSQKNLFAQLSLVGHLHQLAKISFLHVVQKLNSTVKKFLEFHMAGLFHQTKPSTSMITKGGALGNGLFMKLASVCLLPLY